MQSIEYPLCWVETHVGNPDGECTTIREVLESECLKAKRTIDEIEGDKWPFCDVLNYHFTKCSSGDNPSHPLKSKKIVKKPTKPVYRFRTPEGQHFRDEAAKLDNWLYHKRITEYFKKAKSSNPGNPCNPGLTRYTQRGQTLPGRQMWLLETMCRRMGIDVKLIDPTISYWQNKEEIERLAHIKLHLKEKKDNYELEALEREARAEERREAAEFEEYLRSMA